MMVRNCRRFLTTTSILLIATMVVSGASSKKETAVVRDLVFDSNGESLQVTITASNEARYTYFELAAPPRLVLDFHGAENNVGFIEKAIDTVGVTRVRTSSFKSSTRQATRIVFDLTQKVPYRVSGDAEGVVRVIFGKQEPIVVPAQAVATPVAQVEKPAEALVPAAPDPVPVATEKPIETPAPTMADPAPASAEKPAEVAPVVANPAKATMEKPAEVATPVLPNPVTLALAAEPTLRSEPIAAAAKPAAPPPAPKPQAPVPTQQYTGEIISLDLKNVDLKDFFRLIGEISGLNVVLDPDVSGGLTILLKDVPWDQALDVVLKNSRLEKELQGNILRIATKATLQAEEQARKSLLDAQDLAAELVTRTFILNYTKSDAVNTLLRDLLSPRGKIINDARRNALIVTDIAKQFASIDNLVRFLDAPAQQVEIEARLLSANKSFSRSLGSQLSLLIGNRSQNNVTGVGAAGVSPFRRTPPPQVNIGGALASVANFAGPATSGLSFLLGAGGDILLDEIITVAEARGTAKLISRPKVTTQNNQAATVSQGTQIPVQTNVNNTVSVQFINFSLRLSVTPQITDAGTIILTVQIENSTPDFGAAVGGIPSVATQQANTQVLIPDGGTAVIGGILIDIDRLNIQQVPGLGSIPVIGHLFKSTQTTKTTNELLFFITARIKPETPVSLTNSNSPEESSSSPPPPPRP